MQSWPSRPLEQIYAAVLVGVTLDGVKDILRLWAGTGGEGRQVPRWGADRHPGAAAPRRVLLVCDGLKGLPRWWITRCVWLPRAVGRDRYRRPNLLRRVNCQAGSAHVWHVECRVPRRPNGASGALSSRSVQLSGPGAVERCELPNYLAPYRPTLNGRNPPTPARLGRVPATPSVQVKWLLSRDRLTVRRTNNVAKACPI